MTDDAETFAQAIAARRRNRERYTLEAPAGREGDMAFAYAVQDRLAPLVAGPGWRLAGWKIGLTTPRMQAMCGIDEPIVGRVFAGLIQASPGRIAVADHVRPGLESEIALRIGRPFGGGAVTAAEALAHVDAVCAAFEVIDDRGADYGRLAAAPLVADNAWNAGLVLGPAGAPGGAGSLAGLRGVLSRDGEAVDEGSSSDVLGDPAAALAWLVGHLAERGEALAVGQWVSTGSIVPTRFVEPGQTWRFEVAGFAAVEAVVV